ncbi:pyrroloquinoline quinone-dependent dehydrogenase [Candidatus Sumerlaeota bacterium]|nr:pyrroloquinoline quinone-dependent dehydrogenase [Candidatus Sumerlaeota bacterium]
MPGRSVATIISLLVLCCFVTLWAGQVHAQQGASGGEWRSYGGDAGGTTYSPLDQIDKTNVSDLEIAWQWTTVDAPIMAEDPRLSRATNFEGTPLMIGGVLYTATSLSQAAAIDAATGENLWTYDPKSYEDGKRAPNLGYVNRAMSYWTDGTAQRLFLVTGDARLIALDPKTGTPIGGFATEGQADLTQGVRGAVGGRGYGHTSGSIVCRDVVIVGSNISDGARRQQGIPGRVMGYDVRTGKRLWVFNTVPVKGEFGYETWEDGSADYSGSSNVWTLMSADEELGYVYFPTSTPTSDFYGGHRRGDNLFAETLVCVDVETGERVWHFQIIHHGLWDYDLPAPPTLVDITVDGKEIEAVAQVTKHGFTFVFDRRTGEPVWPIEERDVPQSDVPGEQTSPTQPFPTKPPAFERQGVTVDDLIDFTPQLRAEAIEILETFNYGPVFTPPRTDKPTIQLPGVGGGANWPGAAFDPETGILYVPSMTSPAGRMLSKPDPNRSDLRYTSRGSRVEGPRGLPLFKPPYGRITAIDLNKGEHVWMTVNGGDGPRDHPAIKDLNLGPLGSRSRAGALVTKTLLFVTGGSGRSGSARDGHDAFRAFDKATGEVLWTTTLPSDATGVPMTYETRGKQFVVVAIGSSPPQYIAFALP